MKMLMPHVFKCKLEESGYLYVEVPAPGTSCRHEANRNHYSVLTQDMWQCLFARSGFEEIWSADFDFEVPAGPHTYYSFLLQKQPPAGQRPGG